MLALVLLTSTIWFCIAYMSPCRPLPSQVGYAEDGACCIISHDLECPVQPAACLKLGSRRWHRQLGLLAHPAKASTVHSERPGVPGGQRGPG